MKKQPVFILGHKNPDLDSVASVLAYAELKRRCGEAAVVAAVPGAINHESRYVLDRLGLSDPLQLTDVRARVEDLLDDDPGTVLSPRVTLDEIGKLVREGGQKTFPVLDLLGRLLGVVTVGDLVTRFLAPGWESMEAAEVGEAMRRLLKSPVEEVMKTENLVVFEPDDPVGEARQMMLKTRYRNYPVVDEAYRYRGMISRFHLLQMRRKQVVLVDHNEKRQAVDGIEEAELLEVIDHHRVGDLESINPIYFRNEPVGATSTLITEIYRERGIVPSVEIAGLLLAGILSDTMIFRSPTTTERDRACADYLSQVSGRDIEPWGREIFREAAPLDFSDPQGLITEDLKEYSYGEMLFAVAQIETVDLASVGALMASVRDDMEKVCAAYGYGILFLMITDVLAGGTRLIVAGPKSGAGAGIFETGESHEVYLPGVMSRKKQVVPIIYKALARQEMML